MIREETKVHINPGRVRSGDEHFVTVSSAFHGGLCLSFNQAAVDDLCAMSGGDKGVAWFIDAASASDLIAAMREHTGKIG